MVDPATAVDCSNDQPGPRRGLRIAFAHDWVVARRGGERVLDAICRSLGPPDRHAGLWTMFHAGVRLDDDDHPYGVDRLAVTRSALDALPSGLRRWMLPLYPGAVAGLSRSLARAHAEDPIDLLISTSSAAIKSMRAPPGVAHLCYCHTPARYLWAQRDAYAQGGLKGALRGVGLRTLGAPLRSWDRRTVDRVTVFVANSGHTRAQIRASYGRDAEIIHPPVRTDWFTPGIMERDADAPMLVVSALEPYKRVDVAVRACVHAGVALDIVGTGSHERACRSLARSLARSRGSDRVRFLGKLDDAGVRDAMRRARAFLMPQIEDFGITAVEAQSCGTPVIARALGGALDTVIHGQTGVLVETDDPDAWARGFAQLPPDPAGACRSNAERFGTDRFSRQIRSVVDRYRSQD